MPGRPRESGRRGTASRSPNCSPDVEQSAGCATSATFAGSTWQTLYRGDLPAPARSVFSSGTRKNTHKNAETRGDSVGLLCVVCQLPGQSPKREIKSRPFYRVRICWPAGKSPRCDVCQVDPAKVEDVAQQADFRTARQTSSKRSTTFQKTESDALTFLAATLRNALRLHLFRLPKRCKIVQRSRRGHNLPGQFFHLAREKISTKTQKLEGTR